MIQKCPKCGTWCESIEMNASDRFFRSALMSGGKGAEIGKKILGKSGENIGGFFGMLMGEGKGVCDAFFGDKYLFMCRNCKYEWWTDIDFDDATEKLRMEIFDLLTEVHQYKDSTQDEKENYISSLNAELNRLGERIDKKFNAYIYAGLSYSFFIC